MLNDDRSSRVPCPCPVQLEVRPHTDADRRAIYQAAIDVDRRGEFRWMDISAARAVRIPPPRQTQTQQV